MFYRTFSATPQDKRKRKINGFRAVKTSFFQDAFPTSNIQNFEAITGFMIK